MLRRRPGPETQSARPAIWSVRGGDGKTPLAPDVARVLADWLSPVGRTVCDHANRIVLDVAGTAATGHVAAVTAAKGRG